MFRDFKILWIAALAIALCWLFPGDALASIYRGDLPGRGHGGRQVKVPASHPAPAQGVKQESLEEATIPAPKNGLQGEEPISAGSGCETPQPGGGSYCVHPGLLKSRGQ